MGKNGETPHLSRTSTRTLAINNSTRHTSCCVALLSSSPCCSGPTQKKTNVTNQGAELTLGEKKVVATKHTWIFQFGCQMVALQGCKIHHPLGFNWHPLEGAGSWIFGLKCLLVHMIFKSLISVNFMNKFTDLLGNLMNVSQIIYLLQP